MAAGGLVLVFSWVTRTQWASPEIAAAYAGDPRAPAIERFCSTCHVFAPPECLPRPWWTETVKWMYDIAQTQDGTHWPAGHLPDVGDVTNFFSTYAPERFTWPDTPAQIATRPLAFVTVALPPNTLAALRPAIGHVQFVPRSDGAPGAELLVCDMRQGFVALLTPQRQTVTTRILGQVPVPCRVELVDLDQDGVRDLLVSSLGESYQSLSTDTRTGGIVWLRGDRAGDFHAVPIWGGLGRVADVRAADFDADGDLDLVVAVFGQRSGGQILLLENQTVDYAQPVFDPWILDGRPGAIHVPIVDLNGDGRPDFLALISQEFETVVAFLNAGSGSFERRTVYTAPHPAWSCSGLDVADLDGDGDLDLVLANGDTLDTFLLKPYHGLSWLENRGEFPFVHHRLCDVPASHSPKAIDLDGDGDIDIVGCSFAPYYRPEYSLVRSAPSVFWLEQTRPGRFELHALELGRCNHPSVDAADFDGDGRIDLAAGNWLRSAAPNDATPGWVTVLRNVTARGR